MNESDQPATWNEIQRAESDALRVLRASLVEANVDPAPDPFGSAFPARDGMDKP